MLVLALYTCCQATPPHSAILTGETSDCLMKPWTAPFATCRLSSVILSEKLLVWHMPWSHYCSIWALAFVCSPSFSVQICSDLFANDSPSYPSQRPRRRELRVACWTSQTTADYHHPWFAHVTYFLVCQSSGCLTDTAVLMAAGYFSHSAPLRSGCCLSEGLFGYMRASRFLHTLCSL